MNPYLRCCTLAVLLLSFWAFCENKDFNKDKEFSKTFIIRSVNGKITVEEIDHKGTDTTKTNRYVPDTIDDQPTAEWIATHTDSNNRR